MILDFYFENAPLDVLRTSLGVGRSGTSAHRICEVAHERAFSAIGYATTLDELTQVRLPCIIHWQDHHFLVLERISPARYRLVDPTLGRFEVDRPTMERSYSGTALEITPKAPRSAIPPLINALRRSLRAVCREAPFALCHVAGFILIARQLNGSGDRTNAPTSGLPILLAVILLVGASAAIRERWMYQRGQAKSVDLVRSAVRRLYEMSFEDASAVPVDTITTVARIPLHVADNTLRLNLQNRLIIAMAFLGYLTWMDPRAALVVVTICGLSAILEAASASAPVKRSANRTGADSAQLSLDLQSLRSFVSPEELTRAAIGTLPDMHDNEKVVVCSATVEAVASLLSVLVAPLILALPAREQATESSGWVGATILIALGAASSLRYVCRGALQAYSAPKRVDAEQVTRSERNAPTGTIEHSDNERVLSNWKRNESQRNAVHGIRLENVDVTYRGVAKPVLSGVTATIASNSVNVIVGRAGTGKTTLARVISGAQVPSSGVIADAESAASLTVHSLRSLVAVASHEMRLAGAVSDEVLSYTPQQCCEDQEECVHPAITVGAAHGGDSRHSVFNEQGQGWGHSLSSGGRRDTDRALIARALMADRPIIVLDSVDAAMDDEELERMLGRLKSIGRTVVVLTADEQRASALSGVSLWRLEHGLLTCTTSTTGPRTTRGEGSESVSNG